MARPKKVVSKRMAKLLEKQDDLESILKVNKKAHKAFIKAEGSLSDVMDKIFALEEIEEKKAAKKAAK